ncbi:MAG TPA: hypothetical protein GXX75_02770 [Clostridiales bacterium]|nr:hypothetical protein [Clostridiales bacterium]
MKKAFSIVLTLVLCMTMLAGCANKGEEATTDGTTAGVSATVAPTQAAVEHSTDPLEMITDGYYVYSFFVEGYGQYDHFFHFYKEAPVVGAVFYAGFANNQVTLAGTYTVEKKDFSYKCAATRDDLVEGNLTEGTAPYTITFYDFNGNELDSCGFDGNVLYNDMTTVTGSGGEDMQYLHDIDGDSSKFIETYKAEMGVKYLDFVSDADESSTLTLFHNMTYLDMVDIMVEGSWGMESNADGSFTYTLTPSDSTGTGAVLSVAADQASASYTPDGGEAVAMTNTATLVGAEATSLVAFTGTYTTFDLLSDGTYKFEYAAAGVTETGTWSYDKAAYALTITQENGNVITPELDGDYNMSFSYTAVVSDQLVDTFICDSQTWGALAK